MNYEYDHPIGPQENPFIELSPTDLNEALEQIYSLIPFNLSSNAHQEDENLEQKRLNSPLFIASERKLSQLLVTSKVTVWGQQELLRDFKLRFGAGIYQMKDANGDLIAKKSWARDFQWGSETGGFFGPNGRDLEKEYFQTKFKIAIQARMLTEGITKFLIESNDPVNQQLKEDLVSQEILDNALGDYDPFVNFYNDWRNDLYGNDETV